ncbi:hypothetical protein JTB14_003781 [Gonioctena quinquepunctata]|nr:hypothetical protein JTB14_003781 [Gonioctena quinquepunctata]
MASKRKRVVLSLADKLKIIEQLDKGVTGKKLSEIYGVGKATISDIKNSKSTLLNFVSVLENEDGSSSRKTMKTATNKNLEDAVFKWFLQQRSMGNPISGPILCEKAKILAEKLGYSSFKASNGWLRNFKFRHGVRELDLAGEKLSADSAAAENFIEKFKTASESYDPEFVYNADETGLVWKALPKPLWLLKGNLVPLDIRSVKNVLQCLTVPTPLEIINCHFFDRKIKKSKSI